MSNSSAAGNQEREGRGVTYIGLDAARRQVELIYGTPAHPVSLRLIGPKPKQGRAPIRDLRGPVAELWLQITAAQADGFQVYFRPNEGGWTDAEITGVFVVPADFDDVPLPATWHVTPAFVVQRNTPAVCKPAGLSGASRPLNAASLGFRSPNTTGRTGTSPTPRPFCA